MPVTATFEFDVPVRFDTDQMKFTMDDVASRSWGSVPIIELLFLGSNMVFDEVQFPPNISKGASGGPVFQTIVITAGAGAETRIPLWSQGRLNWDVSHAFRKPDTMSALVSFFRARRGKARGFRFKDWSDYKAIGEELTDLGDGTYQLVKRYVSGDQTVVRKITKPVATSLELYDDDVLVDPGDYTLDSTTGIVTYPA